MKCIFSVQCKEHILRPVAPVTHCSCSYGKPVPHLERYSIAKGVGIQEVRGRCWNKHGTVKDEAKSTPKVVYVPDGKGPLADTTSCYIWGSRQLLDKTFLSLPKNQCKTEIKSYTAGRMNLGLGI